MSSRSPSSGARGIDWHARLWASWLVVAVCAAAHGLSAWAQAKRGYVTLVEGLLFDRDQRFRLAVGGQYAYAVDDGEWWRLFTSTLLHGDGLHFLVNAISLLALGRILEPWFGGLRLVVWCTLGAVAASAGSHVVGVTMSDGLSGGVFALLGAGLVLGWRHRAELDGDARRLVGPILAGFTLLNVVLSFALPFVDAASHLWGLGAGVLFGLLARTGGFRRPGWLAWTLGVLWLLTFAGIALWGWAQALGWIEPVTS